MRITGMTIAGRWREICRAPSDEGAGGGAGTGANDAGDPAGGAPGGEGAADGGEGTGDPAGAEGGDGAGGGEKPWHAREGSLTGPERDWLRARGMLTDDAAELLPKAIRGHMAAEKALGKGADKLMDRPKEGQAVAEWLRENGKAFGIPEAPDGYEVTKPDLPEGMSWDDGLEGQFRTLAHEQGMTPDQFNASIGLFANHMKGMFEGAALDGKTAEQEMRQELDRDWGDQYSAKVQLAQSAFQAIAAEAGLDHDQQLAAAFLLKPKVGDAGIMRMFAAIGAKMGDDGFVGGAGVPGVATPQEAKAELQRFMGSDGDYGKAFAAKDHKAMRALEGRRDQLTRMAASRG